MWTRTRGWRPVCILTEQGLLATPHGQAESIRTTFTIVKQIIYGNDRVAFYSFRFY